MCDLNAMFPANFLQWVIKYGLATTEMPRDDNSDLTMYYKVHCLTEFLEFLGNHGWLAGWLGF